MFRRAEEFPTRAQIRRTILVTLILIVIGASSLAWAIFDTGSMRSDRVAVGLCGGIFSLCGLFLLLGIIINRDAFFER